MEVCETRCGGGEDDDMRLSFTAGGGDCCLRSLSRLMLSLSSGLVRLPLPLSLGLGRLPEPLSGGLACLALGLSSELARLLPLLSATGLGEVSRRRSGLLCCLLLSGVDGLLTRLSTGELEGRCR